jgi:RHS repeat-associated protein
MLWWVVPTAGCITTGLTWSASYNGDGARLREVTNGLPTTYTLDLAAPLVTALAERTGATTKQYLYGQGDSPLAVYTRTLSGVEGWTYLSGRDGLNSVRQETDASGNVLTARSFDPYGAPLDGNGGGPFGYTGEQTDVTGLVFLRARYMQPALGMFLSRDTWAGIADRPATIQGYNYAADDPILFRDPAGTDYVVEVDRYTCNDSHAQNGYVYQWNRAYGRWDILPCWVNTAGYTVIPETSPFYPIPYPNPYLPPLPPVPPVPPVPAIPAPAPDPATPTGYLEGEVTSSTFLLCTLHVEGTEVVYDFRSKERGRFKYTKAKEGVAGVSVSLADVGHYYYVGLIWGFKDIDPGSLNGEYKGPFWSFSTGGNLGRWGLSGNGNFSLFSSTPDGVIPNWQLWGITVGVGGSGGGDPALGYTAFPLNAGVVWTKYTMIPPAVPYPDRASMIPDIIRGTDSPIQGAMAYVGVDRKLAGDLVQRMIEAK